MKTKGTHRHDFDPSMVIGRLKAGRIPAEEMPRVLDDACHVILGLRKDLGDTLMILDGLVKTRQYWITGKIDA